jgi:hypothetical protein
MRHLFCVGAVYLDTILRHVEALQLDIIGHCND